MADKDLGDATIVYEDRDGETAERTVQNEHLAYFQDHWILKADEDEEGRDVVHRIPLQRVYHVERSVQEFEQEISTLRDQVESFADELRSKLPGAPRREERQSDEEVRRLDVTPGEREEVDEREDLDGRNETGESDRTGGSDDSNEGYESDSLTDDDQNDRTDSDDERSS